MISLHAIYSKLLLSVLYVKKEKDMIYTSKLKSLIKTILNNIYIIFLIFENNIISL